MVKDEIKYQKMSVSVRLKKSSDTIRYPGQKNDSALCINIRKLFF